MDDLIKLYWDLRSTAEKHGDEFSKINLGNNEFAASFFNMAFNDITITLEILDYYNNLWMKLNPKNFSNVDKTRDQNSQRIILIQKICFIEIMSMFEFTAKKVVIQNEDIFEKFKGRIYLRQIMKRSYERKVIDKARQNQWNGALELRNTLVHNNGISDNDKEYVYSKKLTLSFSKGEMTRGHHTLFPLLINWLLEETRKWLRSANNF